MRCFLALRTRFLRTCSNVFMTFAWYSYLRNWGNKKWYIAAVLNRGIALFEYLFQAPANRADLCLLGSAYSCSVPEPGASYL